MISALFVSDTGPYAKDHRVDPWNEYRDARLYSGPNKVIAHPPCQRWGRYWSGGPNPNAKRHELGSDNGCFESALLSVRTYGGVLEHPEGSHAFTKYKLGKPPKQGGWIKSDDGVGWICCVEQGHYGHKARKATWLYVVSESKPRDLIWGPSKGVRIDPGFRSKEAAIAARLSSEYVPIKRLSKKERTDTPALFSELLIHLVGGCNTCQH